MGLPVEGRARCIIGHNCYFEKSKYRIMMCSIRKGRQDRNLGILIFFIFMCFYKDPIRMAWGMYPAPDSENPVGSESAHRNQAHGSVFLWGIRPALHLSGYGACFLLKLPQHGLRQQMFTMYL